MPKQPTRRTFLVSTAALGLQASRPAHALSAAARAAASQGLIRRPDLLSLSKVSGGNVSGWLGDKIQACITDRVMTQDVSTLVQPFREHRDSADNGWRGEFWGKWFTSAMLAYQYQPTAAHREVVDQAVHELLQTQGSDGDLSTYDRAHVGGDWDVWTRKYVVLGLIAYYDQTTSQEALTAATRVADTVLRDFGPGQKSLQDASLHLVGGLSSCSVLEPICLVYQRTGQKRFLDFALGIVASWERPSQAAPNGMHLVEDALRATPPTRMVAPKAYEMMSCFEGLCELYRITGDATYRNAVVHFAQTLRQTERMVNGSASNQELWCRGAVTQTAVLEQPQETCVTTTWIKLCTQLLRLTGEPVWADEIEVSLYNALAGAQTPNGNWWSYFSPLIGQRVPSLSQYNEIGLSCCVANGPRSLLLVPRLAVMTNAQGPVVNLYLPGSFPFELPGGVTGMLTQQTTYPRGDSITFTVAANTAQPFTLSLRIPAWSRQTTLTINGSAVTCAPGEYARIRRAWNPGDRVELKLDMRGRAVTSPAGPDSIAVMRGPIVLALDSRLTPPGTADVWLAADDSGYVDLKAVDSPDPDIWMTFEVPFEVRPYHFFQHHIEPLRMCDYASAGSAWSSANLYRTWLPQPLYMKDLYPLETWKLMYPDEKLRPEIPG